MRSSYAVAAALVVITGSAALAGQVVQPSMLQQNKGQPIIANPEAVPAQPRMPSATDLHIGIGVICNTNRQAQNYVKLRARGIEISMAVNSVNQTAKDPKACGVAAIAYKRDKTMATKSLNGKVVDIVRVNIFAGYDGHGWARIPEMTQYAIIRTKGIAI